MFGRRDGESVVLAGGALTVTFDARHAGPDGAEAVLTAVAQDGRSTSFRMAVGEEVELPVSGVWLKLVALDYGRARLGFRAPRAVRVDRAEVHAARAAGLPKPAGAGSGPR